MIMWRKELVLPPPQQQQTQQQTYLLRGFHCALQQQQHKNSMTELDR